MVAQERKLAQGGHGAEFLSRPLVSSGAGAAVRWRAVGMLSVV